MEKHHSLVIWAKSQGIKGIRVNMKKVTILNKIKDAGIELPNDLL